MFLILFLIFASTNLEPVRETNLKIATETILWSKCVNIPDDIGQACVELYMDQKGGVTEIGAKVTLLNHTIIDEKISSEMCASEATLLEMLEWIPVLKPFSKLIDMIIKLEGKLPGDVFKVCLEIENLVITSQFVSGDAVFEGNFICWKGSCVWQGTEDFGSFNVTI